jgi:flagellar P-ring protein precursor FlgI
LRISVFAFLLIISLSLLNAEVKVKLKNISFIKGFRENQLLGYGLVVGLPGTGDSKAKLSKKAVMNLLQGLGQSVQAKYLNSKNIASVLVTASLPAVNHLGDRVDVMVSSIGDAKSIEGGLLIQTPLKGADSKTYLVAQGIVSSGSAKKKEGFRSGQKKTIGYIFNGGIVERTVPVKFIKENKITILLKEFDFSLASKIYSAVQDNFKGVPVNLSADGAIEVQIPSGENAFNFIAKLENLEVMSSPRAKVVINEKTGTIVMGGEITVDEVAISQQGLQISISEEQQSMVSSVMRKRDKAGEGMLKLDRSTTVADIVQALNRTGASTSDIINILQALKVAGALNANIEVL